MLEWLNANAGAIQAVATAVLVGVTVWYVRETRRLVDHGNEQLEVLRDRDARTETQTRNELRALVDRIPRYLPPLIAGKGHPKVLRSNDVWESTAAERIEQLSTRIPGMWTLGSKAALHLRGLHDTIRRIKDAPSNTAIGYYSSADFVEEAKAAQAALNDIAGRLDNATATG